MTYWKVLNEDGTTYHHASRFRWSLPTQNPDGSWTPGKWMTPKAKADTISPADLCTNRVLHVCEDRHVIDWLGPAIFEVEVDESAGVVVTDEKVGVRRARLVRRTAWDERTARVFAVECAESVLHLIPEGVERTTAEVALYVARCHADGEATDEELAAAWDAASAAAWAAWAARAAARDAARDAAWAAAWDAARDAAWDAARAAARAAAWDAAWDASDERLLVLLRKGGR